MQLDKIDNDISIKKPQGDLVSFVEEITSQNKAAVACNLIVDLTSCEVITKSDFKLFLPLAKVFKKAKKSLVIVAVSIDFNAIPMQLVVVPSIKEANDIIVMEKIERDLDF